MRAAVSPPPAKRAPLEPGLKAAAAVPPMMASTTSIRTASTCGFNDGEMSALLRSSRFFIHASTCPEVLSRRRCALLVIAEDRPTEVHERLPWLLFTYPVNDDRSQNRWEVRHVLDRSHRNADHTCVGAGQWHHAGYQMLSEGSTRAGKNGQGFSRHGSITPGPIHFCSISGR